MPLNAFDRLGGSYGDGVVVLVAQMTVVYFYIIFFSVGAVMEGLHNPSPWEWLCDGLRGVSGMIQYSWKATVYLIPITKVHRYRETVGIFVKWVCSWLVIFLSVPILGASLFFSGKNAHAEFSWCFPPWFRQLLNATARFTGVVIFSIIVVFVIILILFQWKGFKKLWREFKKWKWG